MNIVPITGRPPIDPCVAELDELYPGPSRHRCSIKCYDNALATLKASVLYAVTEMPQSQCELLRHHVELGNLPTKYIHITRYALERITSVETATILMRKYLIKKIMSCRSDEERFDILCLVSDSIKGKGNIAEQTHTNAKQWFARLKTGYNDKAEFIRVLRIAVMYVGRQYCRIALAANRNLFTDSHVERKIVSNFVGRVFFRRCEALAKVALTICEEDFLNLPIEEQVPRQKSITRYRWESNVINEPSGRIGLRLTREIVNVPLTSRSRLRVRHHVNEQDRVLINNLKSGSTNISDLSRTILRARKLMNTRRCRYYVWKYVNIQLTNGTNADTIRCNLPNKTRCSPRIIKALSNKDFQVCNTFQKLRTKTIDFYWIIPILLKYFGIRWINRHLLKYTRIICKSQHDMRILRNLCTKLRTLILSGHAERNRLQTANIPDIGSPNHSDFDSNDDNDSDDISNAEDQTPTTSPQSTVEEDEPLPSTSLQTHIEAHAIQHEEATEPLPGTSSQTESTNEAINNVVTELLSPGTPATSNQISLAEFASIPQDQLELLYTTIEQILTTHNNE